MTRTGVLAGHSNANFKSFGGYGVNLFFAISGLLITTRILEEEHILGRFDIKRFYIRRLFRIQPAAMFYLAVIAALILAKIVHDQWYYWDRRNVHVRKFCMASGGDTSRVL